MAYWIYACKCILLIQIFGSVILIFTCYISSFNALMLLVGQEERYSAVQVEPKTPEKLTSLTEIENTCSSSSCCLLLVCQMFVVVYPFVVVCCCFILLSFVCCCIFVVVVSTF